MKKKEITFSQVHFKILRNAVGKERAQEVTEKVRRDIILLREERKFLIELKSDESNLH